jgi:hypothetical protein
MQTRMRIVLMIWLHVDEVFEQRSSILFSIRISGFAAEFAEIAVGAVREPLLLQVMSL